MGDVRTLADAQRAALVDQMVTTIVGLSQGTESTTWRILNKTSPGLELGEEDMFDITFKLPAAVERRGLLLDDSTHAFQPLGLPWNIPFVIKELPSETAIIEDSVVWVDLEIVTFAMDGYLSGRLVYHPAEAFLAASGSAGYSGEVKHLKHEGADAESIIAELNEIGVNR